jgi:hypothetical protein
MQDRHSFRTTCVLAVMVITGLCYGGPTFAQVDTSATPTIGMTSPLGGLASSPAPVGPAIPDGSESDAPEAVAHRGRGYALTPLSY